MNASPEPPAVSVAAAVAPSPSPLPPPSAPAAAVPPPAPPAPAGAAGWRLPWLGWLSLLLVLGAAVVASWLAFSAQSRVHALEAELVRRQQASAEQAAEARLAARQAQDLARDASAKTTLLEARVAESALQRSQVEELMQSVARSRDENVVADVEAALRIAMQQSAITGSAEPVLVALRQADERLARHGQPQLERVRHALAGDVERVKAAALADLPLLAARLDELVRQVDELPLLVRPEPRRARAGAVPGAAAHGAAPAASSVAATAPAAPSASAAADASRWRDWGALVWSEVRSLVRVTPIDQPEAMLVAPEQAYFLRENLKLRLLDARLALMSRQFDTAQADLSDVRAALDRYFDRGARSVQVASETVRQVMAQARQVAVPRPDATLAALAAASGGR